MVILLYLIMPFLVHEAGHFLMALAFGTTLRFSFEFGEFLVKGRSIKVPRFVWKVDPKWSVSQVRAVSQAGFVLEFLVAPLFLYPYFFVSLVHFTLYPWYSGEKSDFGLMSR